MPTDDTTFVAADRSVEDWWLGETLELEAVRDADLEDGVLRFRASARTVEGELYLTVEPNVYGEVGPAPEDVSAVDRRQSLQHNAGAWGGSLPESGRKSSPSRSCAGPHASLAWRRRAGRC